VALYGMFLAVIIPPARKDSIIGVLVILSFILSFAATNLPGIMDLSAGTRTIILTLLIAGIAAAFFPVHEEESNDP
ncbi:MAG: branched-chain amino acid ABC transporter permease, partial [Selenomonadaceae bacterium]|nr:branched-chain amino acid ABC transporter permease [Selenomonadaceae bacterium]